MRRLHNAGGHLNLLLPGPSELLMSNILLWSFIPAFPHHSLSLQRNVITVLVPSHALPYLSLLPSPRFPRVRLSIFFIYPPLFFSPLMSLIPSFLTPSSHSSVLSDGPCCTADMRWRPRVCLKCVFVCLSGWWLIRRLTVILWGRPVLVWGFAGLTQIPYYTNTQEYALIKLYTLVFICSASVTALLEGLLL